MNSNFEVTELSMNFDGVPITQFMAVQRADDHRVVATVQVMHHGKYVARILYLFVDPAYRCIGIGRSLLSACESKARRSSCRAVNLRVNMTNERALIVYEKCGYKIVDEDHKEFVMTKHLDK